MPQIRELMSRPPQYDILFEPIQIGPVTAKNRFYQVPHCNGMGYRDPSAAAEMRAVKAEGGWAVVCTEQTEIHPSSDINPFIELRIWDERDIPMLAKMAGRIHEFGALAGLELAYNGANGPNHYSREVPIAPTTMPVVSFTYEPLHARAMSLQDIRDLRRWHKEAALRGRKAGFDLIYVYAGHGISFLHHFLSRKFNHRTDEYGGSLTNRVRLLKEVIEETKDAVGGDCAVPCRISLDELMGSGGLEKAETEDMISMIAELPDLWDVCLAGWENDSQTSRFGEEGRQEEYFAGIKNLTSKPVVGVGRYTTPDRMASLLRSGKLDMIGCARPSIADPFLPKKIETGDVEDIRECIGCNICVTGDFLMSPIRCTQNPSMGEEWRRGWHPEYIRTKQSNDAILIVGAGPCGLEAAQMLGKRGYNVAVAEAKLRLGGRAYRESLLPGLAAWRRVADYRIQQIRKLPNVDFFLDSDISSDDLLEMDFGRVCIATGSHWRSDGVGHQSTKPIRGASHHPILTPEDLMEGKNPLGKSVVVWDDDHYYMGGVVAEKLADEGFEVCLVTSASEVSTWTKNTMEQHFIQKRLLEKEVRLCLNQCVSEVSQNCLHTSCVYTGKIDRIEADSMIFVTSRSPIDKLYLSICRRKNEWADRGLQSVSLIGDALAPATIAHAVYAGRKFAEEFDSQKLNNELVPFRREITQLIN